MVTHGFLLEEQMNCSYFKCNRLISFKFQFHFKIQGGKTRFCFLTSQNGRQRKSLAWPLMLTYTLSSRSASAVLTTVDFGLQRSKASRKHSLKALPTRYFYLSIENRGSFSFQITATRYFALVWNKTTKELCVGQSQKNPSASEIIIIQRLPLSGCNNCSYRGFGLGSWCA